MTQDYIFDDGTKESKVLQHEIPDAKVIKVDKYTDCLDCWLDKIEDSKEVVRIFLHFAGEDYSQKDIYTNVMEAERKRPNLRIVKQYENATRESIQRRAVNYNIKQDEPVPVVEKKEEPKPEPEPVVEEKESEPVYKPYEFTPKKRKRFAI